MNTLNTSFHKLIEGWRACKLDNSPYLFPGDEFLLENKYQKYWQNISSFKEYIESPEFGLKTQKKLHLGLIPIPYIGDLKNATIFILMLNPDLAAGDFRAEEDNDSYKRTLIENLHQKNLDVKYPLFTLNPSFAWHPGFGYWHKKLGQVIRLLARQRKISYLDALSVFAKELACVELVPYHSKSFGVHSIIKHLASSKAVLEFVHDVLVPQALSGKALIIATRRGRDWELPEHEKIVVYNQYESRASHLTIGSRGGKAILQHLGMS
ncbi:SGNH/GDSL hydrolase family protein [Candidatus Leptofilum sp.]|uniref:SGNH/GDSL hydrolase family protein n=1 Tax=Candidatus Leptofilum sp. TaxID=3241576 RepID=UPI003B5CBA49